jgi:hypothetical protein
LGAGQLFTAQVTGTGAFNSSVTWSVNGVNGGNTTAGTIVGGEYTAPASLPSPNGVTITATSVQESASFGTATAILYAPATLTSVTPNAASAGEQITINGQNIQAVTEVFFSGINGTSIPMAPPQLSSNTQATVTVPFGATTGPIYATVSPFVGGLVETTNSLTFTRLPNLLVHAANKDLSSGETLQLDWRLLGASTPNVVTWTADSGSISAQGVFQAPVVSSESYSHVTGCLQNTNSCNTVLLRILPFRITPTYPIVNVGSTLQLDALQGGSLLSPQWSVLAGGGSITSGGLFTAPTAAAQAGPVPISAIAGLTTEQTSVAVEGAFPGLVNRIYDYADFTKYTPPEETSVTAVAVSGNTAYALTSGAYYQPPPAPPYAALDIYDVSNPDQPLWINAVEAVGYPTDMLAYGNTLLSFSVYGANSPNLVVYSLTTQVPAVTAIIPIPAPWEWTFSNGVLYVIPFVNPNDVPPTLPIDLYDLTTGTVVHSHYELPAPSTCGFSSCGITGNGNIIYVSWEVDSDNAINFTIGTYDISQSPPSQLSTVVNSGDNGAETEYRLSIVGSLLFADSQVFDISSLTPVLATTLPVPIERVWGVEGNKVLATGGSVLNGPGAFAVVDVSSPSSPVVNVNVADLLSRDIFNPGTATWAPNNRFYVADGTGGFAVYDALQSGGPSTMITNPAFSYVYDQVISQQVLYQAAVLGDDGGLACFDLSGGTANLVGSLLYLNDTGFAVQVSGTNVFLGLADALKILDASNPTSPVEIGSVAIPVNALAFSGNTLFVGTSDGRLVVFNVSTPTSPQQIASVTMAVPTTMRILGTLLLVAAGQSGLLVFDVSNPSAPALLSQFSPSVSAPVWDVASLGGSAIMLAADVSGIVTVDISNPSQPQQLYQQLLPYDIAFPSQLAETEIEQAFSLATQNGVTYVGTIDGLMFAYDTTVAAVPRLVAVDVVGGGDEPVPVMSTTATDLYLAVLGATVQLDISIPQNSIELYDPPAALSLPYPPGTDLAKRNGKTGNPKLAWKTRRSATGTHSPDRFGVVRH